MLRRLLFLALVGTVAAPLLSAPAPAPTKTPEPKLSLRLKAGAARAKASHKIKWEVTVVNRGKEAVKLVQPGDGSESGWRTPIIEWVVDGEVPDAIREAKEVTKSDKG